jgi:phage terminase large subunit
MPELTLPGKLEFLETLKRRYKVVIGGRGSAKSQSISDLCIKDSQVSGLKIGCFREFQNSIEDSVHSLLKDEIKRLGAEGFNVQATQITNSSGGMFKFRGLARNADAMKSMHGFKRFWVEEAQTISADSLQLLTPTLREEDSEIWMSANPMSSADPFSQRFIIPFQRELDRDGIYVDDMHLIIVSNYLDNPFFPDVLEEERLFDLAHKSVAEYEHIWLGKFNDTVEGAIIPVEWFNSAIDAHVTLGFKPLGATIVTHDPSDLGPDPKGLCVRQGSVILDVMEKDSGDVNEGADWATLWAREYHADVFRWDCDGLGVSLKRQISTALDGMRIDIDMFKGSEGVDNPTEIYQPDNQIDRTNAKTNEQTFRNKRAQYYWYLRDRFYNTHLAITRKEYRDPETLISISSEIDCIDQLRSEICRIPKKYNANGLIQIMSKEDMKKLKPPIPSPNMGDSVMMSMKGHTRSLAYQATARPIVTKSAAGWT